ncbi:uncharacterized protein PHALS_14406 [Plasmopara halstedii]|uniref:Uncharacterized protein n=1 Tax=Plasmopara halstedii TaxID=4781 RepID=A0A0P1ASW4_PLAHL|nr:uncharacterized protein PHALS_14406 [Plasmopara halstedii]CEG44145.1 hypothetical protein PHALS_14406 [Plasmopara halstedii]|eukprot:XP_024580514.1 hypothetical protein PHALS_14406 [Plasmopara halstedii]
MSCKIVSSTRARSKLAGHGVPISKQETASFTVRTEGILEYHSSMSLENATMPAEYASSSVKTEAKSDAKLQCLGAPDASELTLECVLAHRLRVWTKVTEVT